MSTKPVNDRKDVGRLGEQFARQYIERSLGWQICACNWRCRAGELDIVAKDADELVIIEVRTKRTWVCGSPLESVDARKLRQLRRVVPYLLKELHWREEAGSVRLDVLAITMSADAVRHLLHVKGVEVGE